MKKIIALLLIVTGFLNTYKIQSQTLHVPGATGTTPGLGVSINGNVGIGISDPQEKLELYGKVSSKFYQDFPAIRGIFGHYGNAGGLSIISQGANNTSAGSGDIRFLTSNTNSTNSSTDAPISLKMIVKYSGFVGIGSVNPSEKIQIGELNNTENLKLMIPGAYNFEQVKLGQYGNGACGLELINHKNLTQSYGVRFYANSDDGISGLQIQTADLSTSYAGLSYTTKLSISSNGNIGIGTLSPGYKLDVAGDIRTSTMLINDVANTAQIRLNSSGTYYGKIGNPSAQIWSLGYGESGTDLTSVLSWTATGNVLIGKTTQTNNTYKLDIDGKIRANEIVVNTSGADFVFAPTYQLRPLSELEAFVKEHKHLPEVATATEMQENGVSVSEMQTKLLQKVEELTLYLIEKDKQIAALKDEKDKQLAEQYQMLLEFKKELEILKNK